MSTNHPRTVPWPATRRPRKGYRGMHSKRLTVGCAEGKTLPHKCYSATCECWCHRGEGKDRG